jgi:hypothetical protein
VTRRHFTSVNKELPPRPLTRVASRQRENERDRRDLCLARGQGAIRSGTPVDLVEEAVAVRIAPPDPSQADQYQPVIDGLGTGIVEANRLCKEITGCNIARVEDTN